MGAFVGNKCLKIVMVYSTKQEAGMDLPLRVTERLGKHERQSHYIAYRYYFFPLPTSC
jgi:hypothetical protein